LRFGQDKILEVIGKRSMLEQVVACMSQLSREIIIVIAEERIIPDFDGLRRPRIVLDIHPGKGPLGGIYTGLTASKCFYNLVVASDMPFLNGKLLRYMTENAAGFDAVVPRVGRMIEPLHAVYSRGCLPVIEDMIQQGHLNVNRLLDRVKVRYIESQEIDRFDPEHLSFFNINTMADLSRARELAEKGYDYC